MFTKDELKELKYSLNSMISTRWVYLHSNILDKEKNFTKAKLDEDYKLLDKVLGLIDKEE